MDRRKDQSKGTNVSLSPLNIDIYERLDVYDFEATGRRKFRFQSHQHFGHELKNARLCKNEMILLVNLVHT